jgi:TonB family protein
MSLKVAISRKLEYHESSKIQTVGRKSSMLRRCTLLWALVVVVIALSCAAAQSPLPQIAVLPFAGDGEEVAAKAADDLASALENELQVAGSETFSPGRIAPIVSDARRLDFNPRCEDAQTLGARLGCDFYVMARATGAPRSGGKDVRYFETRVDLFFVDARTGALIRWEPVVVKGETPPESLRAAQTALREKAAPTLAALKAFRQAEIERAGAATPDADALDLRSGEVPPDVTPPIFFQRPRPEPTPDARDARVAATVTADVTLGTDGKVKNVEIVRWAGYGLEDAVRAALRGYRFKPAQRGKSPVAIRLLTEFNFRTVRSQN